MCLKWLYTTDSSFFQELNYSKESEMKKVLIVSDLPIISNYVRNNYCCCYRWEKIAKIVWLSGLAEIPDKRYFGFENLTMCCKLTFSRSRLADTMTRFVSSSLQDPNDTISVTIYLYCFIVMLTTNYNGRWSVNCDKFHGLLFNVTADFKE